jgi:hypothetical protein
MDFLQEFSCDHFGKATFSSMPGYLRLLWIAAFDFERGLIAS